MVSLWYYYYDLTDKYLHLGTSPIHAVCMHPNIMLDSQILNVFYDVVLFSYPCKHHLTTFCTYKNMPVTNQTDLHRETMIHHWAYNISSIVQMYNLESVNRENIYSYLLNIYFKFFNHYICKTETWFLKFHSL